MVSFKDLISHAYIDSTETSGMFVQREWQISNFPIYDKLSIG